jgi:hypothetical protein
MITYFAQATVVHVDNPTFGMEFVVFTCGFLVGAICWRFLQGRW